jgi:hypothetical protein
MSLLNDASLLVTPNAYKEGKLYSVIPSNGNGDFTVTRATTATRVNAAGLVELVPYNLLRYSEMFSEGAWGKTSCIITANTTAAPNGTLTADTYTVTNAVANNLYQDLILTTGNYSISIYAKKGSSNIIRLLNVSSGTSAAWFDLNLGQVVGTVNGGTASIENAGNGWYRCIYNGTSITSGYTGIGLSDTANTATAAIGSSVFIWGAQLVEGTQAKDYFATETRLNIPRLDYSLGSCPSILVEPQRTNLFTWSEAFDNVAWTKSTTTITANTTIAPSGLMTADTMSVSSNASRIIASNVLTAGTYTISIWAKVLSGSGTMRFNLTIDGAGTSSFFTPTTEWQRFTYTFTAATSVTTISFRGQTFVGDLAIWGAQLEAGAYPTSYIPTSLASVTRNVDVVGKTGISSLIGQTEGTIYIDSNINYTALRDGIFIVIRNQANAANRIQIFFNPISNNNISFNHTINGVSNLVNSNIVSTGNVKIALAYKNGQPTVMYLNGTPYSTIGNIGAFSTTIDAIYYGCFSDTGAASYNGLLGNAALFPTRLTNTQLAALTA